MFSHAETAKFLKKYKIPYAPTEVVAKKDILKTKIGFPLVLKAVSDDIVHKTDSGGVIVGIRDKKELNAAVHQMESAVKKHYPKAHIDFMLQKMEPGTEVIIGMKRDAQFGPVILFGLGGVFVEVFKDVAMKIAPLTNKDAMDMIKQVKAYRILAGYRSKPLCIKGLADIIIKISRLAVKEKQIAEIDFNPVMVDERRAIVVDARMIA